MSCHGCASKFTLFNKEIGCPNCGFSYCSKCLKYKVVVPKLGKSEHKVCRSCYVALTEHENNAQSSKEKYGPPESFLSELCSSYPGIIPKFPNVPTTIISPDSGMGSKGNGVLSPDIVMVEEPVVRRLESLENPSRPPITLYRPDHRMQQLKAGLNEADREIADRLEKLREERKQQPVPTEEEVAKRLAVLRGDDPTRMATMMTNKMSYPSPDTRTSQEKADSLVQQFYEEQELDSKRPNAVDEITQRLAKLRGQAVPHSSTSVDEKKVLAELGGSTVVGNEEGLDSTSMDDVNTLVLQLKKEMKDGMHQMEELKKQSESCIKATKLEVSSEKPTKEDEECSDEDIERTIQKALDDVSLEETLEDDDDGDSNEKEEELPWCIICNENATIRCIDCGSDLYCKSCFKQGHDEWQMQDHRFVTYTPKK